MTHEIYATCLIIHDLWDLDFKFIQAVWVIYISMHGFIKSNDIIDLMDAPPYTQCILTDPHICLCATLSYNIGTRSSGHI